MRDCIIDIPKKDPFKNDEFNRGVIAENFMKIFETDKDGIVLAIDSDWGTGKTTFIKMWDTLINNNERYSDNYETVYFNAWDNDYMEDPLLALFTEIQSKKKAEDITTEVFDEVFSPILIGIKRFVDIGLKLKSSGAVGIDDFNLKKDLNTEDVKNEMISMGDQVLNRAIHARQLRDNFREEIENFQKQKDGDNGDKQETKKKIIFFIDELDRCRPKFAIELLETIKHLFSVQGIIFVISLDKNQLSHSVATIYGQQMDTVGYLRRFFDLEYKLPITNKSKYIEVKFKDIVGSYKNIQYFEQFMEAFILEYKFSLRDIDKLFYYLKIILPIIDEFKLPNYNKMKDVVKSYLYAYLITLKIKEPLAYTKIIEKDYIDNKDSIKAIFNLQRINTMALNLGDKFTITNNNLLEKVSSEAVLNFLELNRKSKEELNEIYRTESEKYTIKLDGYEDNYKYDMIRMFECSEGNYIISKLEFLDGLPEDIY